MSPEVATNPTTLTKPSSKPRPKTTKKAPKYKKTPKAKKATKKPVKKERDPREKKLMGKNHILYLSVLTRKPLTRKQAFEATGLKDPSTSSTYLGRTDPDVRAADEKKWGYTSLQTLGFVKAQIDDMDGKDVITFSLTAAGRKALEDAKKAK